MTQFDKTTMCLLYLCTVLIISSGVIAAPTGPHNEDEVTCLSKNDTTGKSTKLFIFDDDTWPCQTNDGANNCLNVPMLQRAKESCMNKCCKEDQNVFVSSSSPLETTSGKRKLKPKENPRKTENSSNGHLGIIGGSLGGVIVIIGTVFFLGIIVWKRSNNNIEQPAGEPMLDQHELQQPRENGEIHYVGTER